MENEQMNPSYEQLAEAYTMLLQENQQLKNQVITLQGNNSLNKMQLLVNIIDKFNGIDSMKTTVNKAKWHLNKMLEKPKK